MRLSRKNSTLMKTMVKYFLVIILCMSFLNMFSSFRFKSFYSNVYDMLTKLVDTYSVTVKTTALRREVNNYVNNGTTLNSRDISSSHISEYEAQYAKLLALVDKLIVDSKGDEYYDYSDIKNMVISFNELGQAIIKGYKENSQKTYINELTAELIRLDGYIQDEVKNIIVVQLQSTMTYYENFFNIIKMQEKLIYLVMFLITITCIAIALRFTRQISRPIHQLVVGLKKVAQGEFVLEKTEIKTNDEIRVLVDSYNFMAVKIQSLIQEIKDKADIETELKEQQIRNLEMENLLNQSELKFLQSQINPHFLYNTLNGISALAIYEGAEQTMKMIVSISDILKYYLKKMNENVTLMEELKIVESYLYIQKVRFGERIQYIIDFDQSAMDYSVPGMILQPFVENAIIHGLEPREEQGNLSIRIKDYDKYIEIIVEDDGTGMSKDTLDELYCNMRNKASPAKGIGVSNVIRRLELRYGKDIVCITSTPGKGTKISIQLPKTNFELG